MPHTVVKTQSYGSRVKSSFAAFFIGIIVFIVSFALIFFNTRNYLRTGDDIRQMSEIAVNADADRPDSDNEGKLVAVSGDLTFQTQPSDPTFGVNADAPLLRRVVEVCQWKEDVGAAAKNAGRFQAAVGRQYGASTGEAYETASSPDDFIDQ